MKVTSLLFQFYISTFYTVEKILNVNSVTWEDLFTILMKVIGVPQIHLALKVVISEFGLSILMLILLNHYMFIEVMSYVHDNKWFGEPIRCIVRPAAFIYEQN